jgi:hypothetical protein
VSHGLGTVEISVGNEKERPCKTEERGIGEMGEEMGEEKCEGERRRPFLKYGALK